MGVAEDVAHVDRAGHRGRRGVDDEHRGAVAPVERGPVEPIDAVGLPALGPARLDAVQRRFVRDPRHQTQCYERRGSEPCRRTGCSDSYRWGRAPPVRHRHEGGPRARRTRAGQGEHLHLRADGVRPAAPRSRPVHARVRRADPLPALAGDRGAAGLQRHGHRRPHHRAGPARTTSVGRDHRQVRAGVVDGDGRARGRPPRRHAPRHGVRRRDGGHDRPARRDRSRPTRRKTASTCPSRASRTTASSPTSRSTSWSPAEASARSSAPSSSVIRATSRSGSWPSPASRHGRRRGAKGVPGGTPSAW